MSTFDHRKYRPFAPLAKANRRWPDRVIAKAPVWCSVDLRDGNQALVQPMSVEQKARMFHLLVKLGFKEIEVGFPAASKPDFDFLRKLIDERLIPGDVTIQVLTQARPELIARTYEALRGVRRAIVHVYNSTNPVQREQVFGLDGEGVKAIAVRGAEAVKACAAAHPETEWVFQYSPESFSSTEMDFAADVVNAVNAVWRPQDGQGVIINLPATVEMATPNVFADQVEWFCDHVQQRDHISVSVHTHNDRGCAVAAAELAVMAGADRVEGTLLGNGERTGNMDVITMAMNLYSQGVDPQLDLMHISEIVACYSECTQMPVHPRHPWVGELVYTAFSGSHQDAIRKGIARHVPGEVWQVPYLPIDPRDLGRRYEEVVRINSQSGKGGVAHVLERDYGVSLPRWLAQEFSKIVQADAERTGHEVLSARIWALFQHHYVVPGAHWQMQRYDLHRDGEHVEATVHVGTGQTSMRLHGHGHGVVEALVDALARQRGVSVEVEAFDEFALSAGTEADAIACVRVRLGDRVASAVALGEDTAAATLQAVLSAVGRALASANLEQTAVASA
ncbi:MAG: 2-isopropylmalate synthase [Gammaproteobacteria bacterium SG8_47]|nr:MAG: 2-isopropylmalate synthase [Gammaproteobacteria bacterium SG8_47]